MTPMSESCGAVLVDNLMRFWSFLKSNEAQLLILSLTAAKSIFYYLLRHPMREAKELACVMLATGLLSFSIAISESRTPKWFNEVVIKCSGSPTRIAKIHARSFVGEKGQPLSGI